MNIYIGNLPKSITEDKLKELFSVHGQVDKVTLPKHFHSEELRGFGFVEMPVRDEAKKAIEAINSTEVDGRHLIVNEAKERKKKTGYRRGGGSSQRRY